MNELDVTWDGESPSAIRRAHDGSPIWERLTALWPDALRGFAQALTDAAAAELSKEAHAIAVGPSDEVFALALVTEPTAPGTAHMLLWAGVQATRERVLADRRAPRDEVEEYLWWLQDPEGGSLVAGAALPDELDRAALRAAAMQDARDARRTLAQAAVPLLANRDWSATFTTTPDSPYPPNDQ